MLCQSVNLVCTTDLTDDLPEPHGYHDHDGEQVPFYNITSCIQEAGEEPEDIAFGLRCVVPLSSR